MMHGQKNIKFWACLAYFVCTVRNVTLELEVLCARSTTCLYLFVSSS